MLAFAGNEANVVKNKKKVMLDEIVVENFGCIKSVMQIKKTFLIKPNQPSSIGEKYMSLRR